MNYRNKIRFFWIALILIGLIFFIKHPFETIDIKEEVTTEEKTDYSDAKNKILVITDGALAFSDKNSYKAKLESDGYVCEEFYEDLIGTDEAYSVLNTIDTKSYNTYIINLGYGDFIKKNEIYDNKTDKISLSEYTDIIIEHIQDNKEAKIIFVSEPTYNNSEDKNSIGYNYFDYLDAQKFIISHYDNIKLIELTDIKENIKKNNTLQITNQDDLYDKIIDSLK